jgi:hypothetical protein
VQPPPAPPRRDPHLRPQRRPAARRRRGRAVAGVIAVVVIAGLAIAGFRLYHKPAHGRPTVYVTVPAKPTTPAGVVQAYFADINAHRFARAWKLNAADHGTETFAQFVAGFNGTLKDKVSIESTVGSVVSIQLAAAQTDGAVKTYQGTYTVASGVITATNVQQVSG